MAVSPVVLGLDYGGTKIAAAVCDLAGNRLASATDEPATARSGRRPASTAGSRSRATCWRTDRARAANWSPSACPRSASRSRTGCELAPAIDGWDRWPWAASCAPRSPGRQIRMATDAKAAAHAEVPLGRAGRLRSCRLPEPGHRAGRRDRDRRPGRDRRQRRGRRDRLQPALGGRRRPGARPAGPCSSTWSAARRWPSGPRARAEPVARQLTAADVFAAGRRGPGPGRPDRRLRRRAGVSPGEPRDPGEPGTDRGRRRHGPLLGTDQADGCSRRCSRAPRSRPNSWSRTSRTTRRCSARWRWPWTRRTAATRSTSRPGRRGGETPRIRTRSTPARRHDTTSGCHPGRGPVGHPICRSCASSRPDWPAPGARTLLGRAKQ